MSDPTKASAKDKTLSLLAKDIMAGAAAATDSTLTQAEAERKAAEKARTSHVWLRWAGFFVALALVVVGMALFLAYRVVLAGQSIPIVIAIMFAVGGALPVLVALFCATQASSEFVSLYLGNVFKIGRAVRGKSNGEGEP